MTTELITALIGIVITFPLAITQYQAFRHMEDK